MELINKQAEEYSTRFTSPLDTLLNNIEYNTYASHTQAHMLSGHVQGLFLEMISHMLRPSKVLEIGTFTGFSALCLAKGLADDGLLHTIDIREQDAALASASFAQSNLNNKIKLHVGDAKAIIPQLNEAWDLVFIDADKVSYIDYYELTLPAVKKGGFILVDNVLFHGQVLEKTVTGKSATAIQAFNEHVAADESTTQVMLTVRDGLMLIRKL